MTLSSHPGKALINVKKFDANTGRATNNLEL